MRLKQVWQYFPLRNKIELFLSRVCFSRMTKLYFAFAVAHCFVQVIFQIEAFTANAQAAGILWRLALQGNATTSGFAIMSDSGLRFCKDAPSGLSAELCQVIWSPSPAPTNQISSARASPLPPQFSTTFSSTSAISPTGKALAETVPPGSSRTLTSGILHATQTPPPLLSATMSMSDVSKSAGMDHTINEDHQIGIGTDNHINQPQVGRTNGKRSESVVIDVVGWEDESQLTTLSRTCLLALNWPVERLNNTKREDITFIAFQIWVLGMSTVAILNESAPHIIASFLMHTMATAYGGYQISSTRSFRIEFNRLTQSACNTRLLPSYWKTRTDVEIASFSLNVLAFIVFAILSWRLLKLFGWQTFKRIGAFHVINHTYKLVLIFSIAIQLALFFMIAAIGLWIDALFNGAIGILASRATSYKAPMFTVLTLLALWFAFGWIAVRRELRILMAIFLAMSFGYLGGFGALFASSTFRWTFILWRFFSLITSASAFLTLITAILGLMCRINFGKGLPHYLNAAESLPGNLSHEGLTEKIADSEERIGFPVHRTSLLQLSAALGLRDDKATIKQSRPGTRVANSLLGSL